ncbi:C4-dicarboxylate ABC transporter [Mobiluncus mulieris]|uniref:C4-dicarboxylate ABC transporter n=1 Tax=Mobiluncus mulieris TaxID=2052 RepID=A0A7Y0YHS0_9ACTO|nr:C4-dicarboxylate ABC transporter [Mobiluncus mulieris]NMX03341.1 C4-dicarboxylate ABC transporter [Mobiluncus mulieris]NMX11357.1 C4-dicarboxylate ABC transporter [Mobiluncus mulieris]
MLTIIITFAVIVIALALLAARTPILVALGLPALVGMLLGSEPSAVVASLSTLGLKLGDAFNSFSFLALILWLVSGALVIESGLMNRWFTALYVLADRQVTPERQAAWRNSFLGLPLTIVALLLVAGLRGMVDNHFLLLQMFVLVVIVGLIAGGVTVFSAPKASRMTLKKMRSADGESWRTTAKATAEVSEEGETRRSQSKGDSAVALVLPGLFCVVFLGLLLGLPVGLDDLSGLVFVGSLGASLIDGLLAGNLSWLGAAGWRAWRMLGYLGSTVAGAWVMGEFLEQNGVLRVTLERDGNTVMLVLVATLVTALVLGELFGSTAGAVLAVTVFSGFLSAPFGSEVSQQVASAILTSLLVGSAVIGGIIARVLPPRNQPYPLTVTPLH